MRYLIRFLGLAVSLATTVSTFGQNYISPLGQEYVLDTIPIFDFHGRDSIIFFDDLSTSTVGKFPEKWAYGYESQKNECLKETKVAQDSVKYITTYISGEWTFIQPYFPGTYLDVDSFNIETEFFYKTPKSEIHFEFTLTRTLSGGCMRGIGIEYSDGKIIVTHHGCSERSAGSIFHHEEKINYQFDLTKWHHFALAYQQQDIKVYLDGQRLLNILKCDYDPTNFGLMFTSGTYIKNVLITGGRKKNEFDLLVSEGKFETHNINFATASWKILDEDTTYLNSFASWLIGKKKISVTIVGHTDDVGKPMDNLRLSEQRANAIKQYLVAKGIEENRIATKGLGATSPKVANKDVNTRAINRRVEFIKSK